MTADQHDYRERVTSGARTAEGSQLIAAHIVTPRPDFYVTHPWKGNLLWQADSTPVYFATREQAERALSTHPGDTTGFYVAEYAA